MSWTRMYKICRYIFYLLFNFWAHRLDYFLVEKSDEFCHRKWILIVNFSHLLTEARLASLGLTSTILLRIDSLPKSALLGVIQKLHRSFLTHFWPANPPRVDNCVKLAYYILFVHMTQYGWRLPLTTFSSPSSYWMPPIYASIHQ